MKKILLAIATVMVSVGMNAQSVKVYENGSLSATYTNSATNVVKVVFEDPNYSGPEYVEIGGLKWATMNLGATSVADSPETSYGDYYAWGEVDTYYSSVGTTAGSTPVWKNSDKTHITGTKSGYNWANYCCTSSFTKWSTEPYDATSKNLTSGYDVVQQKLGGSWRMPTKDDLVALKTACGISSGTGITANITSTDAVTKGQGVYFLSVAGCTVNNVTYNVCGLLCIASSSDTKQCVFFPAAGYIFGTSLCSVGTYGCYWSSSLYTDDSMVYYMISYSSVVDPQWHSNRCVGYSVRPVSE